MDEDDINKIESKGDFNQATPVGQSNHKIESKGDFNQATPVGQSNQATPVGVWSDGTDHRQNPSGKPSGSDSFYDVENRRPAGRTPSPQITISGPGSIVDKARFVPVLVCVNGEYKTGGFLGHMTQ